MQVMYSRDDEARRITVTTSGPVTLADILSNIDRQVREHAWTYATLYDTGDAESLPTTEEIDYVIGRVRAVAAQLGRRGALAIVTRNPGAFEIAREYAIVEHDVGAVGFFRDLGAAERWLDRQGGTDRLTGTDVTRPRREGV
jgi:hypothetical protein